MSVYTPVSDQELAHFLRRYTFEEVRAFVGITAGIENTNYFLTTNCGEYVLTLFEQTDDNGLPFCLELMAYLAERGFPAAEPVRDTSAAFVNELNGKPAVIVRRLAGNSNNAPQRAHCQAIASCLGNMHALSGSFALHRSNERGENWHRETAERLRPHLNDSDRHLLDTALRTVSNFHWQKLPQGVIHADLFRDNALFEGTSVSGVIDFYYAHIGCLIYDLGVLVADWCYSPQCTLDDHHASAMIAAYAKNRTIEHTEIAAWGTVMVAVGLRFWLSRLHDQLFPRRGEITHIKDPAPFHQLLSEAVADPERFRDSCFALI